MIIFSLENGALIRGGAFLGNIRHICKIFHYDFRSGVDEDFSEKDVLLTEVVQLMDEAKGKEEDVKQEKNKEEETAKNIRKRAMEGMDKGTCML